MSGIAIYMEGGGNGKDTRSALRQGMDGFLGEVKEAARARSWRWKLVCCGPRHEAFRGFQNAIRNGDDTTVLMLVDAEGPVNRAPREHLQEQDGWDMRGTEDDAVHLMVQTMETWIVADSETLGEYYEQGFNTKVLPRRANLEEAPKSEVERCLNQATTGTRKGRYHKIRHAGDLLRRVDANKAKARCRHCRRLFDVLGRTIDAA